MRARVLSLLVMEGVVSVDTAEKIGLLPGFGWVAGHSWLVTLIVCWTLTPGMMIVIGIIGESRMIPLLSAKQFRSFFPGDLFLGMTATGLLLLAQSLPAEQHWYNATWWHWVVLAGTITVAVGMTILDTNSGYPIRAILSPTKLYHNIILYGGYGYVIVATLIAVIAIVSPIWAIIVLIPGFVWVYLVVQDMTLNRSMATYKARHAHVADWRPIWRK